MNIIGPGYLFGGSSGNPIDIASSLTGKVGAITFNSASSGSTISGLEFSVNCVAVTINGASNITIERCGAIGCGTIDISGNSSNITIRQNYWDRVDGTGTGNNILISNNIIKNGFTLGTGLSGIIANNVYVGENHWTCSNFSIYNNIYAKVFSAVSGTNNTIFNNLSAGTAFGAGSGNLTNVDMSTVFVLPPASTQFQSGFSIDSRWQIKTGSPSIGAGFGGADCGAFAGSTPYVLSGLPPYPIISKLQTSGGGNSTTPLSVTVSTKSNN